MENASKALIMAGSVLLAIMVIGLLLFSWGKLSDFKNNDDELEEVDNISKFNLQFANYENRKVYGYEIISLANKVVDYNMRYSDVNGAKNDEKYKRISMNINLVSNDYLKLLCKGNDSNLLFNEINYSIDGIENIVNKAEDIEDSYGSAKATTDIAKSIDSLILSQSQLEYNQKYRHMSEIESKVYALELYNRLTDGEKITGYQNNGDVLGAYDRMVKNKLKGVANIMAYYEYYQFKRAIFKCTGITYDDNATGRVTSISFEFNGKIE